MVATQTNSYYNSFRSAFICEAIVAPMPQARPEHFIGQIWQEISIS